MEELHPSSSEPPVNSSATFAFPLTSAQLRLWFLEELAPDETSYLIAWTVRIRGPLDPDALRFSLNDIVKRHEVFRTRFVVTGGEPVQLVIPEAWVALPEVDLSYLGLAEAEAEARQLTRLEAKTPISLQEGPLLRGQLVRLAAHDHVLLLTTHHICFDGWSRSVLVRELGQLYSGYIQGQPIELPELPIQYGDFAVWQQEHLSGAFLKSELGYWKEQLKDLPLSVTIPSDRPRPAVQTVHGFSLPFTLSFALMEKVKWVSRHEGVTPYMTLLAAFQTIVARYSGQYDVVIGTPTANRNRPELEGLIGLFANTLVLRTQLGGDPTFRELLQRVKDTALSAYAHEEMPFEQLVQELRPERSLSHSPLFQILFSLRNTPSGNFHLPGLQLEGFAGLAESSKYDLSLYLEEHAAGYRGKVEYNTDLYDASTIDRILRHFETLLESAIEAPEKRLSELDMLGTTERKRLLVDWNDTVREYPRNLCVHQLFERQAGRRGHAVAVEFGDEKVTYAELNLQANHLAHYLRSQGAGVGQRIGLFVDRSPAMFVGLLGIQKSGAAYVPLDPSYPAERVRATLEAAGITLLVSQESLLAALPEYGGRVVCLDRDDAFLEQQSGENPQSGVTPDDLVYVIFTSGSTGTPKGVELGHRGVVNLLDWMQEELHFSERDVFPALASFAFDMSIPELYLALAAGGTVALAPKQLAADGEELTRFLRKHGATLVHATPTTWSLLLDAGFTGANITRCIGAEPLPAELFGRLMDVAPGTPLYNFYGPTETTVWSTFHRFDAATDRIVIGRPLANTQLYIVDRDGNPAPIGVAGELLIGGDGVAKGYLNQPDLTAEKFVPDTFSGSRGASLYRTGDLARYLPDGRVEFGGRLDHQVKIRGFRIELGEIETVLAQQPVVRECVVLAREDHAGDKRLVAYVVAEAGLTVTSREMREWVKQRLPDYMVPSAFVELERMPLSPNGKVDRKALPAPEPEASAAVGSMENPIEEMVANIWAEVLKTSEVTQTANFFELGGHSLLATKVVARIRQAMQVNLPLGAIFEFPTVAGLAARVNTLMRDGANSSESPLVPANWGSVPKPLSFAQRRLWFLDQLEPNSAFYNVPLAMRLTGPFDASAMQHALAATVARHESLRTTFQLRGEEPVQVVADEIPLPLVQRDLSSMAVDLREAEAQRLVTEEAKRPFDLAKGPLFRALLVTLGPEDHVFMVNMHHAISDGWSLGVFMNDVTAFYESVRMDIPAPLQPLPLTYGDFAVWQREHLDGGAAERQLAYWKTKLAGAPPSIELPTDRTRPPVQTFHGAKRVILLPPDLLQGLKAVSRAESATLFLTLLTAFNVLLSRYSGQKDIVVGTANGGRHHPDTEKMIGFFANTVVLRTDLEGEPTFRELVRRVRETTLHAFANQDVPFERLVEELNPVRDLSRSPVFQVMIIQQNAFERSNKFGSLKAMPYKATGGMAKVDLLLSVSEDEGRLRCALEYNTDLYNASTIDRMLLHFETLLGSAIAAPEKRLSELNMLGAAERNQLLVAWNDTTRAYPREFSVPQLFEQQVVRSPQSPACISGETTLTYAELNARANQLAHFLVARDIGPGSLVGICLNRTESILIALLAVQKTGAAYLPLDPTYPQERLGYILDDADAKLVITEEAVQQFLPAFQGEALTLDSHWTSIAQQSSENLAAAADPEDLAYVLHTSGSTGKPKGVEITHRNLVNFLISMQQEPGLSAEDKLLAVTTLSFDIAGLELYLPLMTGACVVLCARPDASSPTALMELIDRWSVTVMQATPATWLMLFEAGWKGNPNLKVLCGGEALPQELAAKLASTCRELWNMYGPTETTIWSSVSRIDATNIAQITIGHPIANTTMYVLDQHRQLVPLGVSGELYIGGEGVGRGYWRKPELTAERFVPDPFVPGNRMYRTGDVARFLPNGTIQCLGRIDQQVKIRGYRIELGEIESVLMQQPVVRECVVLAREDHAGAKRLVAYVVAETGLAVTAIEMREWVKDRLPEYMVPTAVVMLARMPLTPNGKVDRKALPVPGAIEPKAAAGISPKTPVEIRLASIWEELLQVKSVRLEDDFFNLGGHSLLAVQMMSRAREAFGCELPLTLLFGAPRLGDLARVIQMERGKQPFKALIPIRKTGTKPPLFCVSRPNVNALGFIFLSRNLSPDQPVIGLQTQMEKDGATWVYDQSEYEERAAEYVKVMRESYPDGPYLLTGYCEGAHIAFEMARQLEAMGQTVGMLAILDAWPVENTVNRTKYILRSYLREFRKFRTKKLSDRLHSLTGSILKRFGRKTDSNARTNVDPAQAELAAQRALIEKQVAKRYWPGPDFVPTLYSGRLTLFRTKRQLRVRINDYKMGWGKRATGGVDVYPIPGVHGVLLREPSAIYLAKKMQECIDRALAEQPPVNKAAVETKRTTVQAS